MSLIASSWKERLTPESELMETIAILRGQMDKGAVEPLQTGLQRSWRRHSRVNGSKVRLGNCAEHGEKAFAFLCSVQGDRALPDTCLAITLLFVGSKSRRAHAPTAPCRMRRLVRSWVCSSSTFGRQHTLSPFILGHRSVSRDSILDQSRGYKRHAVWKLFRLSLTNSSVRYMGGRYPIKERKKDDYFSSQGAFSCSFCQIPARIKRATEGACLVICCGVCPSTRA